MTTWEDVHAGDIVIGHDDLLYGIASVEPSEHGPRIVMRRDGRMVHAQPPPGTPIRVWAHAGLSAEAAAWQLFEDAGLRPQIIRETHG